MFEAAEGVVLRRDWSSNKSWARSSLFIEELSIKNTLPTSISMAVTSGPLCLILTLALRNSSHDKNWRGIAVQLRVMVWLLYHRSPSSHIARPRLLLPPLVASSRAITRWVPGIGKAELALANCTSEIASPT